MENVLTRAFLISVLALAVPVMAAIWFPERMEQYEALLWLLALVPAFLLAFARGWQGAATALALGMALLSATYATTRLSGGQVPEILFPVVVIYIAITLGLGWFGAELERARDAARAPGQLVDDETGLPTWTYAARYLDGEFEAARRGRGLAVVLFEVDGKGRAPRSGRSSRAAAAFVEVLRRNTRKMNVSARCPQPDRQRFVSILTNGDFEGGAVFARRVLDDFRGESADPRCDASAGVAVYRPDMGSADSLVRAAEEALAEARRAGGDRVRARGAVIHSEPGPDADPTEAPAVKLETTPESRTSRALVVGAREGLTAVLDALEGRGIEAVVRNSVDMELDVLDQPFDLAVVDADAVDGAEQLVRAIRHRQSLTQTLIVIDEDSTPAGLAAMNAGAARCLTRPLTRATVEPLLTELLDRRDALLRTRLEQTHIADELTARQREVERLLDATQARHREVLHRIQEVVFEIDTEARWRFLTPAWETLTGSPVADSLGHPFWDAFRDRDREALKQVFQEVVDGSRERIDMQVVLASGAEPTHWVALTASPSITSDGHLDAVYGTLVDVTERRRLEEQLRQAQKMEAIGQLAGGIAHDFNNLLLAIRGHAEFALALAPGDSEIADDLRVIVDETDRASGLTRQLLAFSREHVPDLEILDLGEVVHGMEGMLTRLLGENIAVRIDVPDTPLHVEADEAQLQQVIMNLATNARDAMPEGGQLLFRLEAVEVSPEQAAGWMAGSGPGLFVLLTVRDTGLGMDRETARKAFDPFFTTKAVGKGTGLGLSSVLGIVMERNGHVEVESRKGGGTEFRIWLPRADRAAALPEVPGGHEDDRARHGGTILVVEDEPAVRSVVRRYLEDNGFRVHAAASGEAALEQVAEVGLERLGLVMTDVIMPGLSGIELVERLRKRRPDLPAVFMSGYAEEEMLEHGQRLEGTFLNKPFDLQDLLAVVGEALDTGDLARHADPGPSD